MKLFNEDGLQCRVHTTLGEVDPAEWDALLDPDDLQATHRFGLCCERSGVEGADYRWILIHERGQLLATAALSRMTVLLELLAPPPVQRATRVVRSVWPPFLKVPVLFCGLPVSFGASCLRIAPEIEHDRVLAVLARRMEETAREMNVQLLCFKEFTSLEAAGLAGLSDHGYFRAASLPSCSLPLHWSDPAGWVAEMRAGYRRQLAADARAADRAGLVVRQLGEFDGCADELFRLYADVWERAANRLERLNPEFFRQLARNLPEARALVVERQSRLVGMAILLDGPTTTTFLLAGVDSTEGHEGHLYPLLVRTVVETAIRRGSIRCELGQTSYPMKLRLGATPSARWLWLRLRAPWRHALFRFAAPRLFPDRDLPGRRVFSYRER